MEDGSTAIMFARINKQDCSRRSAKFYW